MKIKNLQKKLIKGAGKGDRNRTINFKAYWNSDYWCESKINRDKIKKDKKI